MRSLPFTAMAIAINLFWTDPVHSTLVVFQWTPKRILVGADSLNTLIVEPKPVYSTACKIYQEQDVFFALLGLKDVEFQVTKDSPIHKFDFVAAGRKASREPGGLEAKILSFRKLAGADIRTFWQTLLKFSPQSISGIGNKLTFVIASRSEHAIAVHDFAGQADGSMKELTQSYGSRLGQLPNTEYKAAGASDEAQAAVARNPALSKAEGVPFIVGFIEAQIQHEKTRLQAKSIQRVGGPFQFSRLRTARQRGYVTISSLVLI